MTMNDRHQPFEELISASLAGQLTPAERQRLDAHLDGCAQCRATLAAFAEQRRIMAGLRHVPPPRDLGARVRAGIEHGRFAPTPWWRRPPVIFAGLGGGLAAVTGALLALVVLNGTPDDQQVGQTTPTPTASPAATTDVEATPAPPSAALTTPPSSPAPTLPPSPDPEAPVESATPPPAPTTTPSPEPDVFLAYTGTLESPALEVVAGATDENVGEVEAPVGPPIAAELSPDTGFLAVASQLGESGMNEIQVTRLTAPTGGEPPASPPIESEMQPGDTVTLAQTVAGDPFVERMAWSPSGQYLAFTVADPDAPGRTDVSVFDAESGETWQLTDAGNAYAGSWVVGEDGAPLLWVSSAAEVPVSHLVEVLDADGARREAIDPAESPVAQADGVFVPILNPDGRFAIYWTGRMAQDAEGRWIMAEGGAPYLSEHRVFDRTYEFANERPLFSDLLIDRDAFTSAVIVWGADGDSYAVSRARWAGLPQGDADRPYPDERRVYFGHATDPRGLTRAHAIDAGDIPEGAAVVDVKVSPTGRHLVITALRPIGGVQEPPKADLLLVTRNTEDVPDDVKVLGDGDDGWFGPAAFDESWEAVTGD
jgi:hypothetical protein